MVENAVTSPFPHQCWLVHLLDFIFRLLSEVLPIQQRPTSPYVGMPLVNTTPFVVGLGGQTGGTDTEGVETSCGQQCTLLLEGPCLNSGAPQESGSPNSLPREPTVAPRHQIPRTQAMQ